MYRILPLLDDSEIAECRRIAANTQFIDGRASNPHSKAKNNQQLLTKYEPGQYYGPHADAAFINLGNAIIRSDLSCTIFLNEPDSYDGGALRIRLQDGTLKFKLKPGEAILYPSDTFHEVEEVTSGERLVAITFIQSKIADPFR